MRETKVPPIKFVDLPAQHADMEQEILDAVADLIRRGAFVGGPALTAFEDNLARYCGVKYAVGCSDGTAALVFALKALGIRPGEGCVVPTNSFIASANSVIHAGGRPILVDCDPNTYLIDLNQVEDVLRRGEARFVLPVHLYGNPCPMDEVLALAERYGARVVEDNAQAIGAEYRGRKTGSFGAAAGISFYPAKNLGAFGQGGAVLTDDESVAKSVRMYTEQGQGAERYHHDVVGYNGRLHSLQAVILDKMLKKLDSMNAARLRAADQYAARLPAARLQQRTPGAVPVFHLMEYRCDSVEHRDQLAALCTSREIPVAFHYPIPIHQQKAFPEWNGHRLPVAESLAKTLLSLPMHPGLLDCQIAYICDVIDESTAEAA